MSLIMGFQYMLQENCLLFLISLQTLSRSIKKLEFL